MFLDVTMSELDTRKRTRRYKTFDPDNWIYIGFFTEGLPP